MKKLLILFVLFPIFINAEEKITIKSEDMSCDVIKYVKDDIYLELKEVSECFNVNYTEKNGKISLSRNVDSIESSVGIFESGKLMVVLNDNSSKYIMYALSGDKVWVSSTYSILDNFMIKEDGKYLVTARFISEVFKSDVTLDGSSISLKLNETITSFKGTKPTTDTKPEPKIEVESPVVEPYVIPENCTGVSSQAWCTVAEAGVSRCGFTCSVSSSSSVQIEGGLHDMLNSSQRESYITKYGVPQFGWTPDYLTEVRGWNKSNTINGSYHIGAVRRYDCSSTDCSGNCVAGNFMHQVTTNYGPNDVNSRYPYCDVKYAWFSNKN